MPAGQKSFCTSTTINKSVFNGIRGSDVKAPGRSRLRNRKIYQNPITRVISISTAGADGALLTGRLARVFRPIRLLLVTVIAGIVLIAITPFLGTLLLLFIAAALRGGTMGMSQPLMISSLARFAGAESQGKGVRLRATANRLMNTLFPVVMGAVVESAGLENGFYIMGTVIAMTGRSGEGVGRSDSTVVDGALRFGVDTPTSDPFGGVEDFAPFRR